MYISIDLGRSTTRVASSLDLNSIFKIAKFPTKERLEDQKSFISNAITDVCDGKSIEAIAFGFPGISSKVDGKFKRSANYPQIEGLDFSSFFPESLKGVRVIIENDAALGALGESYFGSGKDKSVIAYLTLSTGVGGSRVRKYEKGYDLINAEPGHHIIDRTDELPDGTGIKGTFESFCSGPFFERRYGDRPDKNASEEAWKTYASNLSVGILNIISMWRPEVIILGGGVSIHNFDSFYPFLLDNLKGQSFFDVPDIRKSSLEDDSGIYGGFILLKENI